MNVPEAMNAKLIKCAGLASALLLLLGILGGCGASTLVQTGAPTATRSAPTGTATLPPSEPPSKQTPWGTPLVTTTGQPGGWTSYTDPQLGFTLQVPNAWLFDQSAQGDGGLWQWQGFSGPGSTGIYENLAVSTISAPDPATQQFCATKPTTTVAGAPAVIADRAIDPAYAPNIQSIMERDVVVGGSYYSISFAANLPLPQAQQQLLPFFMIAVDSFTVADKTTGTVKC